MFVRRGRSLYITKEAALGIVAGLCVILLVLQPFFYFGGFINATFVVSLLCFFLSVWINRPARLSSYAVGYGFFALFAVMSLIWSPSLGLLMPRARDMISYFCILFVVSQYCLYVDDENEKYRHCDRVMSCYIYSMLAVTIAAYVTEGTALLTWARLGQTLYLSRGMNQIQYSCFMLVAFYFTILKLFNAEPKMRKRYIILALFLYLSFALMGIRKVLVLPIIFLYVFLLWKNREHALKIIGVTIGVGILFVVAFYLVMTFSTSAAGRLRNLIALLSGEESREGSYIERNLLVSLAWNCFKDYPVLGRGLGQFRWYSVRHGGPDLYAHNNFMEVLSCLGIVGFVLYYKNMLSLLFKEWRSKSNVSCFAVATVVAMICSDIYQISYYYECFAVLLAVTGCLTTGMGGKAEQ